MFDSRRNRVSHFTKKKYLKKGYLHRKGLLGSIHSLCLSSLKSTNRGPCGIADSSKLKVAKMSAGLRSS
jgi:hypothetical protein